MQFTKREFVGGGLAVGLGAALSGYPGAALASFVRDMTGASQRQRQRERPLPELLPYSKLPVCELDVEASQRAGKIILRKGLSLYRMSGGCRVQVPAGAEIPIKDWTIRLKPSFRFRNGARLIFEGPAEGPRPRFYSAGRNGLIHVMNTANVVLSLELENIALESGLGDSAVRIPKVRYVRLTNVSITGGKNGLFFSSYPTIAVVEDSEIQRSGRGGGLTHCLYAGYIEKMIVRNSSFHSAKADGHAFKCYASQIDVQDSQFANWLTFEDREEGFTGGLPAVDLGAWALSIFTGNTIIRRGPARTTTLQYRNRQYRKGYSKYLPKHWGTEVVDPALVDNRDITNPYLFHHILAENRFVNGVLPDGGQDPEILKKPGTAVRNNGTAPWSSGGNKDPAFTTRPATWQDHNERAVVWALNNRFEGIPYNKRYDTTPGDRPGDTAPIREVEALPALLGALADLQK